MGILALMYVLPHVETLGGFWAVFAAGTAVAAWVNFGSPRVSYGGYQIGLAFYKVVLQGWGPVTTLTVARDRLVGIALGLVVFGILEHVLWPVRASELRQQRFANVLRSLAALTRLGGRDRTGAGWDRELDAMRRQITQDLEKTQRLLEESKFELQASESEAFQRRVGDAQIVFLVLLSIGYQRRAAGGDRRVCPLRRVSSRRPSLETWMGSRIRLEAAPPPPGRRSRWGTGDGPERAHIVAARGAHRRRGGPRGAAAGAL